MESYWFLVLVVRYGYLLGFFAVFLDNTGLPLPGELVLLVLGFLAQTGHLDPGLAMTTAGIGAVAGDHLSYWLGRLGGPGIVHTYCRMTLGSAECVDRAVAFYRRFGPIAIVLGRFVMGLRAFLMPLAGSVRMPYGQFVLFDGLGAFFWSSLFIATGYLLGNQAGVFGERLHRGLIFLGLLLVIAFIVYLAMKFSKLHRHGAGLFTRHLPGEPLLPERVQSAAEDPTKLACA